MCFFRTERETGMDENQNYGYNEGNYGNQGANDAGQPYANQQHMQQSQPYGQNGQPYGQQPQYNQAPYGAQPYNQNNFGQPVTAVVYDAVPDKISGVAVASLVCGILGLIFFWIPGVDLGLCLAGLICGIIAIVRGLSGKGLAIAGLILSIIDGILTLLFLYFFALGMMLM